MPEVKYIKIFQGYQKYGHINEIEPKSGIETIRVKSFPHMENRLHIISLIRLPPKFNGEISGRIAKAHVDMGAGVVQTPNEITWLTFDKKLESVVFIQEGEYPIEILVDNIPIHSVSIKVIPL